MIIRFDIDKNEAIIAVMYLLGLGEKITSKKQFRSELNNYFRLNGISCQDDHDSENGKYEKQATALVDKYF